MKKLLLIGCPNAGKSAVFNLLTGRDRKVANYSGVTVDFASSELRSNPVFEEKFELIDLPGIYSLCPHTDDEAVTVAALAGEVKGLEEIDGVIVLLDFVRMESSLKLLFAIQSVWCGAVICIVNKCDNERQKERILSSSLSTDLDIPLFPISALADPPHRCDAFIRQQLHSTTPGKCHPLLLSHRAHEEFERYFPDLESNGKVKLVNENEIHHLIDLDAQKAKEFAERLDKNKNCPKYAQTLSMDRVLLHPFWGMVIFVIIFYLLFLSIYSWSTPFMELIDVFIANVSTLVMKVLPSGFLQSLVVDGIIAGIGASLVFLPQIMILFFLISVLNQSGYISRASILTDNIMSRFGLNGKAFLPFLSGFACSVPAIMATRILKDRKERFATIMVLPFITCSARLPVYVLLIGTFIPKGKFLGVFDKQALSFFFLYFLGTVVALIFAKIFRLSFFAGKSSSFVIELPHYQRPRLRQAVRESVAQGKIFVRKVGTIILFFSIIIWGLSTFPKLDEQKYSHLRPELKSAVTLENSYLGRMGKTLEPVIHPLGFDWKMGVGILSAFAARELFVSTLGTIYALGDEVDENNSNLRTRMSQEVDSRTGKKVYSLAVAWSLIIFFAFACQCMSTLAIVRRETESWKYVVIMFSYMLIFAYMAAWGTYRLLL